LLGPGRRSKPVVAEASRAEEPVSSAAWTPESATTPILGYVPSPFGNASTLATRSLLLDRLRTAWPTAIETEHVPSLPAFRTAIHAVPLEKLQPSEHKDRARTIIVTSSDGAESRTTLSLGLAEAAAGQGRRVVVIDADENGSLLRELVTSASRPVLIDVMGTTRVCYRIVVPFRGSLNVVPILPGEAQIVRRLGAQGAAARIDGISQNFDLVIFDGPNLAKPGHLDALAATADAVIVAAPKAATREDIDRALAKADLPASTAVAAVLVADLTEGRETSAAA
jgi:Mrp family chromosome partitioning ATPase